VNGTQGTLDKEEVKSVENEFFGDRLLGRFVSSPFTTRSLAKPNLLPTNDTVTRTGVYKSPAKKYSDHASKGCWRGCRLSIFLFFRSRGYDTMPG
jgi:hypothetical protein